MIGREYKIVEMSDHHVDDVVAIENQTNPNPWSAKVFIEEMSKPTFVLLVAVDDISHKVLGFTGGQIISNELHIHSLAVEENSRRNKIGSSLIQKLLDVCKTRDATCATLEVRRSNNSAIDLYTKLGFRQEGIREKYYADNGEDALIMWLREFGEKQL